MELELGSIGGSILVTDFVNVACTVGLSHAFLKMPINKLDMLQSLIGKCFHHINTSFILVDYKMCSSLNF